MRSIYLIVFAAVAVAGLEFASSSVRAQRSARPIFSLTETPRERSAEERLSIASVLESGIAVDPAEVSPASTAIEFPLLDGKTYRAFATGVESRSMTDFTWRGKLGRPGSTSDVILTWRNGHLAGLIYTRDAVFEIAPRGDAHVLAQLDQSRFPECGGGLAGGEGPAARPDSLAGSPADSGDRIDVLVVYTTATKNAMGGDGPAQTLAQQSVDSANTAYLNSKIRTRLRMVHSKEHVYVETGTPSTDLSNLRNNATIQALRTTHNADLVALIGEVTSVCGIGYLMGAAAGNQNNGFTFTARTCAVGNLSFAHEVGHNMGSQHNPENGSGPTFPYGFGHYVNGSYRTVMSYVDPCPAGCTRRPYFSNPAVSFSGVPTGIADARDNARSINNLADVVANYRYSGSSITLNNFNGGEMVTRLVGRAVTWSSNNLPAGNVKIEMSRDEGTTWETVVASTANDGSENVSLTGRPTKNARVRIVSLAVPTVSDSSTRNIFLR